MTKVCPVGLLEPWRLTFEPVELFLFRFQGCQQLSLLKSQSKGKILYCKCPDILPIYRNRLINKSAIRDSLLRVPVDTLNANLLCSHVNWFAVMSGNAVFYMFMSSQMIHTHMHPKLDLFSQFNFKGTAGLSSSFWLKIERILYSFQVFYIS